MTDEETYSIEDYVLYGPRDGKSLKRSYPELEKNVKLKDLSNEDLLFAWLIGIPGSPVDPELVPPVRFRMAAARAFPKNEVKKSQYASQDYPDSVKQAIREFEKMSPEARLMANLMTQRTFHRLNRILNVDVDKDFLVTRKVGGEEITEVNWTSKKQYVDSADKIMEMLPTLVQKIEEGYGMTEKQKKDENATGTKSIDIFHANK